MWRRVLPGGLGDRLATRTTTRQRGRLHVLIVFAALTGVTKFNTGWLVDVAIGNTSDKALPVNPDDLHLGRSAAASTRWRVGQGFLHDRTTPPTDGTNGERIQALSVLPGTTRTVRVTFINVSVSEGDKWLLGYFSTAAIPLEP